MSATLLVLGTKNRKKAEELVDLLALPGVRVATLADFPPVPDVDETGDTFAANAALKAIGYARAVGAWVLGEDSGIVVDALKGAPGVYSARYSGPAATDHSNNDKLLAELAHTPLEKRTAHYVCRLALADPTGTVRVESGGKCQGRIRFEPRGTTGFGYDPLFEIVEYHRTFAELGPQIKHVLSHRARAVEAILPELTALLHEQVAHSGSPD